LALISVLAVCYFAAAKFGLAFAIPPGNATAVWPPSGLALAAVLVFGYRAAWGIWLGAFLGACTTGISIPTAVAIGIGNAMEALLAAWMFRGHINLDSPFDRAREAFQFGIMAGASSAVSATVGVTALMSGGYLKLPELMENWGTWWLGDVTGLMVVAPLILSIVKTRNRPSEGHRWPVVVIYMALLLILSQIVFGGWLSERSATNLLYLPMIFLIWVALKCSLRDVTVAVALFSVAAIWGASRGVGAYGSGTSPQSLFDLQLFISLFALTGLAMSGLVTRRRRVIKDLSDMKYALDQSAIVAYTNPQGIIEHANDKFCEICKYTCDKLLGKNHRILNSGYHSREFFKDLWRTIRSGKVWHGEICNRARDGSLYWMNTTIIPLLNERGRPYRYMSIRFDITARKKANAQYRRLFQAVEKTTDIVFITNRNGEIEYANPAFEKITGYSRDETLGQTPRILKSGKHGSTHYESLWKTILSGDVHRATTTNRKKNGKLFHAEQTITPVKDNDGNITHFVSVLKDITNLLKKKEQEMALRLAREVQQLYYGAKVSVPGFDIAGAAQPADETGGDYFDFISMPDGCVSIVIGDVSGHGISAALVMAETRAYLRSFVTTCEDAGMVLSLINRVLAKDLRGGRFVTLLLVCLNPRERILTYASAGHEPGYLIDESGNIHTEFLGSGPPLGLFPDAEYSSSKPIPLSTHQALLLLTDGITESAAHDGTEFGSKGAISYFNTHRHEPAPQIVEGLHKAVEAHAVSRRLQDDITSVILKVI
jgi:PAS domain S-box-containing protein